MSDCDQLMQLLEKSEWNQDDANEIAKLVSADFPINEKEKCATMAKILEESLSTPDPLNSLGIAICAFKGDLDFETYGQHLGKAKQSDNFTIRGLAYFVHAMQTSQNLKQSSFGPSFYVLSYCYGIEAGFEKAISEIGKVFNYVVNNLKQNAREDWKSLINPLINRIFTQFSDNKPFLKAFIKNTLMRHPKLQKLIYLKWIELLHLKESLWSDSNKPSFTQPFYIDKGSYGAVFKHREAAIKVPRHRIFQDDDLSVPEQQSRSIEEQILLLQESAVLKDLQGSPYILGFKGLLAQGDMYGMVVSWAAQGSLYDVIRNDNLPVKTKLMIAEQIVLGVQYIHTKGYYHRDIKPNNILLTLVGNEPYQVMISDVATAKLKTAENDKPEQRVGTVAYASIEELIKNKEQYNEERKKEMPPLPEYEHFLNREPEFTEKSDVYSVGMTLWELFTAQGMPLKDVKIKLNHKEVWVTNHTIAMLCFTLSRKDNRPDPSALNKVDLDLGALVTRAWDLERNNRPNTGEMVNEISRIRAKFS